MLRRESHAAATAVGWTSDRYTSISLSLSLYIYI